MVSILLVLIPETACESQFALAGLLPILQLLNMNLKLNLPKLPKLPKFRFGIKILITLSR